MLQQLKITIKGCHQLTSLFVYKSRFYGILSMILEYDIASIVNKCRQMMQQQAIMSDN